MRLAAHAPAVAPITPGPILFGSALLDGEFLEGLVDSIGSKEFGSSFFGFFDSVLHLEQCTVFAFEEETPSTLLAQGKTSHADHLAKSLADIYVDGAFKADPNFAAFSRLGPRDTSVYMIERDDLSDANYRRCFYDDANLAHEIVILYRTTHQTVYLGLYRNEQQGRFDDSAMQAAREISGVAIKALGRHLSTCRSADSKIAPPPRVPSANDPAALVAHLKSVFLKEGARLSMREAEVIAHICVGYSSYAIAAALGITTHTVATHRKRAYAKLRLCSQNELFSRYLQNVVDISVSSALESRAIA